MREQLLLVNTNDNVNERTALIGQHNRNVNKRTALIG